jgi:hypothetical protein
MGKCLATLLYVTVVFALNGPARVAAQNAIIEGGGNNTKARGQSDKPNIIPNSSCVTSSGIPGKATGGTDSKCVDDPNAFQGPLGGPTPTCPGLKVWDYQKKACE